MDDCSRLGQVICSSITARFCCRQRKAAVAAAAASARNAQRVLGVSQVKRRQLGALVVVLALRRQVSLKMSHSNRLLIQSELKFVCSAPSAAAR